MIDKELYFDLMARKSVDKIPEDSNAYTIYLRDMLQATDIMFDVFGGGFLIVVVDIPRPIADVVSLVECRMEELYWAHMRAIYQSELIGD